MEVPLLPPWKRDKTGVYMHSSTDLSEDTEKRNAIRHLDPEWPNQDKQHTGVATATIVDAPQPVEDYRNPTNALSPEDTTSPTAKVAASWRQWLAALRQVFPIYVATHLVFLVLTYCAALFTLRNFSSTTLPLASLLNSWYRWDSGHFTAIATNGYDVAWRTAFFPSFPLLEHLVSLLTHNAFVAGLLISNIAGLLMLAELYRLVQEDFDHDLAWRTALYLAIFPTAFFFAAAYNESLFLLFTLLGFYYMRRGRWWLAGLFGLLASLTRSAGICLLLPFCYEYLRQHDFTLNKLRFTVLSCLGIPAGIGVFALYCYYRFHDLLAFSHAQAVWGRSMHGPWHGLLDAAVVILHRDVLSFDSIHNVLDLSACLFILALVIFIFIGPWKFPRQYLAYGIYAAIMYLFSLIFPISSGVPLGAFSRYLLEVFPAFIVLAAIGKRQSVNLYYWMLSVSLMSFMLLQFLTGHWII